jgi:GNAT superfamily N-acetyltransferase
VALPAPDLRVSALSPAHVLGDFASGVPARDAWLHRRALPAQQSGDALTHVAAVDERVVGFCTLSTAAVMRSSLPGARRRNAPDPVPALLIGQLAVDLRYQGGGIGMMLAHDAMRRAMLIARYGGWRLLAVNPDGEKAESFWAKLDFVPVSGITPPLMVLTQAMVRGLLEAAGTLPG